MVVINCRVIDNQYTAEDRELACLMANNILDAIERGEYIEGQRNNMAVDLACMCHVLKADPKLLANEALEEHGGKWQSHCSHDIEERLRTISRYLDSWDVYGVHGVFDYMMMEWEWKGVKPGREWIKLVNNVD